MKEETAILQDFSWAQEPTPWPWWLWLLLIVTFLLLVAVAGYFVRRRRLTADGVLAPREPAHVTALEALARLESRLGQAQDVEFVVEVSQILRVYIQDRFALRAPHRSTEEFLLEASENAVLDRKQQQLLADFLSRCDLVKFARHHVVLDQMKELFGTARRFVEQTAENAECLETNATV